MYQGKLMLKQRANKEGATVQYMTHPISERITKPNYFHRSVIVGLLAIATFIGALSISAVTATAQDARIQFTVVKAGLILGFGGGSGTLYYKDKAYPISIGGISVGATIGASVANLSGTVRYLKRPSDIEGNYSAAGGSAAYVVGVKGIKMKNNKGVVVNVAGPQVGLEFSLDLSGMSISLQ
jgi:hypothetical protein